MGLSANSIEGKLAVHFQDTVESKSLELRQSCLGHCISALGFQEKVRNKFCQFERCDKIQIVIRLVFKQHAQLVRFNSQQNLKPQLQHQQIRESYIFEYSLLLLFENR